MPCIVTHIIVFLQPPRKVFLCKNLANNNHVVIKQIPVDELPPEERKSAMNEVNVLSMLQHPNIIAYYSSFVEEKSLMIAMEYAPGGTLYELIQERNGKLIEEEVRRRGRGRGEGE